MTKSKRDLGAYGEDLAVAALQEQGYQVLARNARFGRLGEIDVVAQAGDMLVFVEVRTRSSMRYGLPAESITPAKKTRLLKLGLAYTQRENWQGAWRIDIVSVFLSGGGQPQICIYPNAVEAG